MRSELLGRIGVRATRTVAVTGACALISVGGMALASDPVSRDGQRLSLAEAERRGLENYPRLKATREEARAIREQAASQKATFLPRLTFDATYRYVSIVPQVKFGPQGLPLGDNENYTIGPTLSYTVWDFGARSETYRGLGLLADSRQSESETVARQALQQTRIAYTQAQLAQTEMNRVSESLGLARTQNRDIERRFRAGAVSRLDLLNSQNEVSSFEIRAEQARGEYLAAVTELNSWVGAIENPESLELDTLAESTAAVDVSALKGTGPSHPQVLVQERLAASLESTARGQEATRLPTLQLQARSSLDYPNGPNLEQIHQNSVAVSLTVPLVEWGRTTSLVEQKRAEASAAHSRREQSERDLRRDWSKALVRLESLSLQAENATRTVRQSEEIAQLRYESYKAGKFSFSEVQTSNLRLLEARIQKARIEAQILAQFHILRALEAP